MAADLRIGVTGLAAEAAVLLVAGAIVWMVRFGARSLS
jgi:hypothetical protein